jgi:hypothetical protein
MLYSRADHRRQYGACALHAGYLRLPTHIHNIQYSLLFHCNVGCTNAPQYYVIITLPVTLHFRFLLPFTVVCQTAFTCYFTKTSNISLDVRRGPIFTPQKLLCVICKDPLSSVLDCKCMPYCKASIFLLVTTVSISVWCSMVAGVPFLRSTSPVICASLLSRLCYMFLMKVPHTCRNNMQDSILYLLRHKAATRLLLPSLYVMLQALHRLHRGSVAMGLTQSIM